MEKIAIGVLLLGVSGFYILGQQDQGDLIFSIGARLFGAQGLLLIGLGCLQLWNERRLNLALAKFIENGGELLTRLNAGDDIEDITREFNLRQRVDPNLTYLMLMYLVRQWSASGDPALRKCAGDILSKQIVRTDDAPAQHLAKLPDDVVPIRWSRGVRFDHRPIKEADKDPKTGFLVLTPQYLFWINDHPSEEAAAEEKQLQVILSELADLSKTALSIPWWADLLRKIFSTRARTYSTPFSKFFIRKLQQRLDYPDSQAIPIDRIITAERSQVFEPGNGLKITYRDESGGTHQSWFNWPVLRTILGNDEMKNEGDGWQTCLALLSASINTRPADTDNKLGLPLSRPTETPIRSRYRSAGDMWSRRLRLALAIIAYPAALVAGIAYIKFLGRLYDTDPSIALLPLAAAVLVLFFLVVVWRRKGLKHWGVAGSFIALAVLFALAVPGMSMFCFPAGLALLHLKFSLPPKLSEILDLDPMFWKVMLRKLAKAMDDQSGDAPVEIDKFIAEQGFIRGLNAPPIVARMALSGVILDHAESGLLADNEFASRASERLAALPTPNPADDIAGFDENRTVFVVDEHAAIRESAESGIYRETILVLTAYYLHLFNRPAHFRDRLIKHRHWYVIQPHTRETLLQLHRDGESVSVPNSAIRSLGLHSREPDPEEHVENPCFVTLRFNPSGASTEESLDMRLTHLNRYSSDARSGALWMSRIQHAVAATGSILLWAEEEPHLNLWSPNPSTAGDPSVDSIQTTSE